MPVTLSVESGSRLSTGIAWVFVTAGRTIRPEIVLSSGVLFAEPVTVIWRSSDLSNFPTAYATALATEMGVEMNAGPQPSPTLSARARAGIAAGAVLGVIFLFGSMMCFCMRKRNKARQHDFPEGMAEMPGHSAGLKRMFRGKWRAELDGRSQPTELDSRKVYIMPGPPVELEAPHHYRYGLYLCMKTSGRDSLYDPYAIVAQNLSIPGGEDDEADANQVIQRGTAAVIA